MKNRFSHKLMAVLMTIVVFLSTMSFTLDMHYCEGNLVQTTVFHKGKVEPSIFKKGKRLLLNM